MKIPSLKDLNDDRKTGYRPEAVGCLVNNGKVLFVYKKEHNLWQLPQGGVDPGETLKEALTREMEEELGSDFITNTKKPFTLIGENKITFPPQTQGSRKLQTKSGKPSYMKGKKYYFFAVPTKTRDLNLAKTEFDKAVWMNYKAAKSITKKYIYQKGKKRITLYALQNLREKKFL